MNSGCLSDGNFFRWNNLLSKATYTEFVIEFALAIMLLPAGNGTMQAKVLDSIRERMNASFEFMAQSASI